MKDALQQCMADLKTTDHKSFQETFCQRCRNLDCVHAQGVGNVDKFSQRVKIQPERLFHPNQILQPTSRYAHLVEFTELKEQAGSIDLSRRKGEWEAVDLPDAAKEIAEEEPEAQEPPKPAVTGAHVTKTAPRVGAAQVRPGNTEQPTGGIILGSGPLPVPATTPEPDPWAPPPSPVVPGSKTVSRGAKVRLGG